MKKTIPNSNSVVLTGKEWILTVALAGIISFSIYFGWDRWEKIGLEPDYRSTCWEERMSDYWAYGQWSRIARGKFKILLVGDSEVWGQEVVSTGTISHCLNEILGSGEVANLGIDGLSNAAMEGLFRYYGRHIRHTNIILQFNPLWMSSPWRDMRENWIFHHPRLVRQLDGRIHYYRGLSERLGYLLEHYLRLPPFVRHLMVNYFENKSIAVWLLDHPYRFPFGAITFMGTPVMREKQGLGTPWSSQPGAGKFDDPFLLLDGSVQWECYLGALQLLKDKGNRVFVLLGPYNTYNLTDTSRARFFAMMDAVKKKLGEIGYPYFDSTRDLLPSGEYADKSHVLRSGHALLARAMAKDTRFRQWLAGLNGSGEAAGQAVKKKLVFRPPVDI